LLRRKKEMVELQGCVLQEVTAPLCLISQGEALTGDWWFTPVILTTQEAETRRIVVPSQLQSNSSLEPLSKILNIKKGWWSGIGPEFKPWYRKKKKEKKRKKRGGGTLAQAFPEAWHSSYQIRLLDMAWLRNHYILPFLLSILTAMINLD
jgi:hypothetical protein